MLVYLFRDASIEQLQSRLVSLRTALNSSEEKLGILQALQLGKIPSISTRRPVSPADALAETAVTQPSAPRLSATELEPELEDTSDETSETDSDVIDLSAVEGEETRAEDREEASIEGETVEGPPPAVFDDQPGADLGLREEPRDHKSEEIHTHAAVVEPKSSLKGRAPQKQMVSFISRKHKIKY